MNWTGVDSNARCDKTRQISFFFPNEKERKFARKRGGGEKERERGGGVGDRWCLTFFQRYYKVSEGSCLYLNFMFGIAWSISDLNVCYFKAVFFLSSVLSVVDLCLYLVSIDHSVLECSVYVADNQITQPALYRNLMHTLFLACS